MTPIKPRIDADNRSSAKTSSQRLDGWLAEIDALLQDPRGRFRPRTLVLIDAQRPESDRLVMQVGLDEQGRINVATAEALSAATSYWIEAIPGASDVPEGLYVLEGTRLGHRPDDVATPCWINTLVPADPTCGTPAATSR